MQITMMKAVEKRKTFVFENKRYKPNKNGDYEDITDLAWILKNANSLVEVEDNYWDSDGRFIVEPKENSIYAYIDKDIHTTVFQTAGDDLRFGIGNCFKNKESAQAELERLKEKQKERMATNGK